MTRTNQVILKLEGGLGNQLFQFAAGYYLAARIGGNLTIDQYSIPLTTVHGETGNGFESFNLNPLPNGYQVRIMAKKPNRLITRLAFRNSLAKKVFLKIRMFTSNPKKLSLFVELNELGSNMKFLEISKGVKLHGNFQSWEIVEHAALLGFPRILRLKVTPDWIKEADIDFKNAVVLHLRLGDDSKFNPNFKQPSIEYYISASKILETKLNNPKMYILSDDIQRAKDFLGQSFATNIGFLEMPQHSSPAERMFFMSLFGGIACANSTFCGWAAWSIHNSGGNVVVPVPYSDGPVLGSRDFPSNWIKLDKYSGVHVP